MAKIKQIDLASAQLTGFMMASKGYNIINLAIDMGLTKKEWEILRNGCGLKESDVLDLDRHFGLLK